MINAVNPSATVQTIDARVDATEAQASIAAAGVVFGCLDRDLPRLKLIELCARYAKPLFDLASDTGGEGDELWYGGRVVFARLGLPRLPRPARPAGDRARQHDAPAARGARPHSTASSAGRSWAPARWSSP